MQNRNPEELKQIAIDIRAGRIFCDRHCSRQEDVAATFAILNLMDKDYIDKLRADPPGLFYEYLSEAGPRGINGNPMFFSIKTLSIDDTKTVFDLINKLKEAECAVNV